jgi:hypothetical protein
VVNTSPALGHNMVDIKRDLCLPRLDVHHLRYIGKVFGAPG